jgi:hypothetical protein
LNLKILIHISNDYEDITGERDKALGRWLESKHGLTNESQVI